MDRITGCVENFGDNESGDAMKKRDLMIVALVAFIFGIAGSYAGHKLFNPQKAVAQPAGEKVVAAERFELLDESGKVRGIMAVNDGEPGMGFFDEDGGIGSVLTSQSLFMFNGATGKDAIHLGMSASDETGKSMPVFNLYGDDGSSRIWMGVNEDNAASIMIFKADGGMAVEWSAP